MEITKHNFEQLKGLTGNTNWCGETLIYDSKVIGGYRDLIYSVVVRYAEGYLEINSKDINGVLYQLNTLYGFTIHLKELKKIHSFPELRAFTEEHFPNYRLKLSVDDSTPKLYTYTAEGLKEIDFESYGYKLAGDFVCRK